MSLKLMDFRIQWDDGRTQGALSYIAEDVDKAVAELRVAWNRLRDIPAHHLIRHRAGNEAAAAVEKCIADLEPHERERKRQATTAEPCDKVFPFFSGDVREFMRKQIHKCPICRHDRVYVGPGRQGVPYYLDFGCGHSIKIDRNDEFTIVRRDGEPIHPRDQVPPDPSTPSRVTVEVVGLEKAVAGFQEHLGKALAQFLAGQRQGGVAWAKESAHSYPGKIVESHSKGSQIKHLRRQLVAAREACTTLNEQNLALCRENVDLTAQQHVTPAEYKALQQERDEFRGLYNQAETVCRRVVMERDGYKRKVLEFEALVAHIEDLAEKKDRWISSQQDKAARMLEAREADADLCSAPLTAQEAHQVRLAFREYLATRLEPVAHLINPMDVRSTMALDNIMIAVRNQRPKSWPPKEGRRGDANDSPR